MDAIGAASDMVMYAIIIIAVIQDFCFMRISNRLILVGLAAGLFFRMIIGGPAAFVPFLGNVAVPVIVLYLLFLAGAIGAGDIKLFSVIGGFVHIRQLAVCMIFSFVIGAVLSLARMIRNQNLQLSLYQAFGYFAGLFQGEYKTYRRDLLGEKNLIHFSFAICLGILIAKGGGFGA